jgi:dienelactone hydrolase
MDYLETRDDIDPERIAFYGMSWGGKIGPIIAAVEPRVAASVLLAGGLGVRSRPEVLVTNYAPRVETPTLMLNGMHDQGVDATIRPTFELLGTQEKDLLLFDTDHIPPRAEYIKETLAWLDKYLGPVER